MVTSVANILSLSRVIKNHHVTFDSRHDNAFHVHLKDGHERIFHLSIEGLYYSDIRETSSSTVLVNTAEYNKNKYSHDDYSCAVNACILHNIIGNPSYAHFKWLIAKK